MPRYPLLLLLWWLAQFSQPDQSLWTGKKLKRRHCNDSMQKLASIHIGCLILTIMYYVAAYCLAGRTTYEILIDDLCVSLLLPENVILWRRDIITTKQYCASHNIMKMITWRYATYLVCFLYAWPYFLPHRCLQPNARERGHTTSMERCPRFIHPQPDTRTSDYTRENHEVHWHASYTCWLEQACIIECNSGLKCVYTANLLIW